ncbi:MAG: hypothetical protein AMJ65_03605 [Phycisphaerae bacterium SG8_4]|nr:MAG: hypothetical protein AMJ65_03605 [Phycisphaerae bacterium SG8_4]
MRTHRSVAFALLLVAIFAASSKSFADGPVRVTTEANVVSIHEGSSPLLRYAYRSVPYKPCVQQLFTPGGVNVLRDSPADHKHHHALMYAVSVDGLNFWEEQKQPGRQMHKVFSDVTVSTQNDVPHGGFTEQLDWVNPETDELLLNESRTIAVYGQDDSGATLLSWQSSFTVPGKKESATLSGSHYFGLGMRFVETMDAGPQIRNSSGRPGEIVRGSERLVRARWCALAANADGKPVTVAMFCHPDNLRHPTHWFTMTAPFAYLSATMNLHREPLKITSDEPLRLRYAVALWDGSVEDSQIDRLYRRWVEDKPLTVVNSREQNHSMLYPSG